ncbi:hypothetical protein AKO1_013997 [Acrasis kona]|uniref:MARVEL domain-containing protein n=1 Tax=Acrasis kona TaxID=1008807 RepID=A0AAW2Z1S6_9EUKA
MDPEAHTLYDLPTSVDDNKIVVQIFIKEDEGITEVPREEMVTKENVPIKNWPACKPVLRHDIANDTDPGLSRKVAYAGYTIWILHSIVLVLNLIISIVLVSPLTYKRQQFLLFEFVTLNACLLFVVPLAHFAVYWQLYKAQVEKTVQRFILSFISYAVAIFFTLILVSGVYTPGIYMSEIYVSRKYYSENEYESEYGIGFALSIFMSTVWSLFALAFIAIFILDIILARRHNHSIGSVIIFARNAAANLTKEITRLRLHLRTD